MTAKAELNQGNLWKEQAFTIAHADSGAFEGRGLRAFFEYRKLGIDTATSGKFGAHVIRAVPGRHSKGEWHTHDLDFQMVYVTRAGWCLNMKGRASTSCARALVSCNLPVSATGKSATPTTWNCSRSSHRRNSTPMRLQFLNEPNPD